MCEVNASLAGASPARDHFKIAAEKMVAEVFNAASRGYYAYEARITYVSRYAWFLAALTSGKHVAKLMANTEEMRIAMEDAFDQALRAYL